MQRGQHIIVTFDADLAYSTCDIGRNKRQGHATLPFLKIAKRHWGPPSRSLMMYLWQRGTPCSLPPTARTPGTHAQCTTHGARYMLGPRPSRNNLLRICEKGGSSWITHKTYINVGFMVLIGLPIC